MFGDVAKSNIFFTVIDLDRLIMKHSTELDNRPFGTLTIGVSWARLPNNSIGFAGIKSTTRKSIVILAGAWVRLRRNERENLSIQTK